MRRRLAALLLGLAGLGLLLHGLWIPAKAALSQVLLRQAWAASAAADEPVRPWPWADTWPVARLLVPSEGIDQIVLAGAHGSSLAFAPGHLDGTALPGGVGNSVVAGHRDTHFRFLRHLRVGDEIRVQGPAGERLYRVQSAWVVDHRDLSAARPSAEPVLTLVTCYPFDAVVPGGPLRYVVRAVAPPEQRLTMGRFEVACLGC